MIEEKYTPWDSADFLTNDEVIIEYLKAALEENDPAFFMKAIGNVARSKGMSTIAQETHLGRPSLYKALSGERDPKNRHRDESTCRTWNSAHYRAETNLGSVSNFTYPCQPVEGEGVCHLLPFVTGRIDRRRLLARCRLRRMSRRMRGRGRRWRCRPRCRVCRAGCCRRSIAASPGRRESRRSWR